ncbi:hypothetical protein BH10BAC1_BH10BAC1_02870 [soil metagenome]
MKKTVILFSLFVTVVSASAQEGIDLNPKPKPKPDTELKRNEISINTAPVFKILLGATNFEANRFSFTFKRNLSSKSALRFSLMADKVEGDEFRFAPWNEVIILESNNVMIKQTTSSPAYLRPHVNIGYERHFGKHKLQWFYGADATCGYSKNNTVVQNKLLTKDTTQGPNTWIYVNEFRADIVSRTDRKIISVGISPFFGAKYPISKRFSISAQVGVDMTFQKIEAIETQGTVAKKFNYSTFDFNGSTGLLNDISLVYKF